MRESKPVHEVQIDHNVPIPMRDGTILRADVYHPKKKGRYPVIVARHGYNLSDDIYADDGKYYARRGYVMVANNCRGRFHSEGERNPWINDGWGKNRDGYDTIEWAGHESWSDGNVGMYGPSYRAVTQYLVAPTRPPSLKACFARIGFCSHREWVFPRGVYRFAMHRGWSMSTTLEGLLHESAPAGTDAARQRLEKAIGDWESWMRDLPVKKFPPLEGTAPWYFEELNHPPHDPWWQQTNAHTKFEEIDVPFIHMGGWADSFLPGAIDAFTGIRKKGCSAKCRNAQQLVVGPWIHAAELVTRNDWDCGADASFDLRGFALKWFDYWLKGIANDTPNQPPVRVFLMGDNKWVSFTDWPPKDVKYEPIYLHEGSGKSESSLNNGILSFEIPKEDEQADSYEYDPDDPIKPGRFQDDQRNIEGRVLTYTSKVLDKPLAIIGPVKSILYASSSAPDTDWVVRLCDVLPDGTSIWVCDGILRARYRNSLEKEQLMAPGQIYRLEVDMWATAQTFLPGHRIRVQITSSSFPEYDRNLNTGGPFGEETQGQIAINTIFHDAKRPSYIVLPVMPQF